MPAAGAWSVIVIGIAVPGGGVAGGGPGAGPTPGAAAPAPLPGPEARPVRRGNSLLVTDS